MSSNAPVYVILLLAHGASALFGFGAVSLDGLYASRMKSADLEARRYFSSRRVLPKAALVLAGILGVILVGLHRHSGALLAHDWLRAGIAVYLAVGVFIALGVWPRQARLKKELLANPAIEPSALETQLRFFRFAAALVSVALALNLILMVLQPGP